MPKKQEPNILFFYIVNHSIITFKICTPLLSKRTQLKDQDYKASRAKWSPVTKFRSVTYNQKWWFRTVENCLREADSAEGWDVCLPTLSYFRYLELGSSGRSTSSHSGPWGGLENRSQVLILWILEQKIRMLKYVWHQYVSGSVQNISYMRSLNPQQSCETGTFIILILQLRKQREKITSSLSHVLRKIKTQTVCLWRPCCQASVCSSVLSHHNKDLEQWTLKP